MVFLWIKCLSFRKTESLHLLIATDFIITSMKLLLFKSDRKKPNGNSIKAIVNILRYISEQVKLTSAGYLYPRKYFD